MKQVSEESLDLLQELGRRSVPSSCQSPRLQERLRARLEGEQCFLLRGSAILAAGLDRLCLALVTEGGRRPVLFEWRGGEVAPVDEARRTQRLLSANWALLGLPERRMLACLHLSHRSEELETGSVVVAGEGHRLAFLLEELSLGLAFLRRPVDHRSTQLPPWILGLSVFSLGQLLAALLEAEVWGAGPGSPEGRQKTSRNEAAARIIRSGMTLAGQEQVLARRCLVQALRELVLGRDEEKLRRYRPSRLSLPTHPRSLVQVSQRRASEDFTCRRVAAYDMSLIRLWLLGFVACGRSIELTPKWLRGADRLMTTPLMLMMTPLQEFRFLLFRQVYRLASAEYHSSLLCGEEGSQVPSECRKDVSTRKKRRRQRKQPAGKALEQAPTRITPAGSHVEDLNIGLAPSEVTQRQITATETHVLVLHLLRETIDEILCHVSDDVLQTSPLSAQPLFPVQDRDPEPVPSSTNAAPESEFCAPDEPFESNFSTYSLWLSGGLMWRAPLVIPQPVESSLEKGSDEQFGFFWDNPSNQEGALGVIEDEAEGDLVALTTAALRAHTVFYESQIANGAAETRRKNSWSLRNKSDGYPTAGKGGHHSKRDPQAVASPSKYPSSTLRYFYPKGLLVQ